MVIAEGTPEQVADNPDSFTGAFLKPLLDGREAKQPARRRSAPTTPAAKGPATKAAPKKAAVKKTAARKTTARKSA
jgi:excinuclease ABC subunit A